MLGIPATCLRRANTGNVVGVIATPEMIGQSPMYYYTDRQFTPWTARRQLDTAVSIPLVNTERIFSIGLLFVNAYNRSDAFWVDI